MQIRGGMEPGARSNVAFSCWRGLASSVKARQRLYRRKMQGRASPLQRDVSPAFALFSAHYRCICSPPSAVGLSSCWSPFPGTFAVILHQSEGDEDPAAVCVVEQVDVEPVTENS